MRTPRLQVSDTDSATIISLISRQEWARAVNVFTSNLIAEAADALASDDGSDPDRLRARHAYLRATQKLSDDYQAFVKAATANPQKPIQFTPNFG